MAIDFRCVGCRKLLRVGDENAGKQAKCPECGALQTIPAATSSAPLIPSLVESLAPPPITDATPTTSGGELRPTRITVGEVYSRTWAIFKQRMGPCLLTVLGSFIALGFAQGMVESVSRNMPKGFAGMLGFAMAFFNLWVSIGVIYVMLKIARGREVSLDDMQQGHRWIISYFVTQVIVVILLIIGFVLLVIPGIIVALMLSQALLLVIDRDANPMDALRMSYEITSGNKGTIFLIWLLGVLSLIFGTIFTLGFGLIFLIPFFALLHAVMYLMLTGQPTAEKEDGGF